MPVTAAKPVVEKIAEVVISRLQLLVANWSELFFVAEAFRPTVRNNPETKDRQLVLKQLDDVRVPELDCPGNPPAEARSIVFGIHCRINPSESDTTSGDEFCNSFTSIVRRAICQDDQNWHTMDGLAIDASFGSYTPIGEDGGVDGVGIELAVTYRVSERDPFEQRG